MNKLLSAGFCRLTKSRVFWAFVILSVVFALYIANTRYQELTVYKSDPTLERSLFNIINFIGILMAVFTSIFIGTDYADGTIRNKLIVGHTRTMVYLSNFIISTVAGYIIAAVYILVTCIITIPMLGFATLPVSDLLMASVDCFFLILSFSSLLTMIAMIVSNKTTSAVTCILLMFGLMFVSTYLLNVLSQPKTVTEMVAAGNGEQPVIRDVPNPGYVSGTKRDFYQFAVDFNPAGQALELSMLHAPDLKILSVYSGIVIVLTTSCGLYIFRRKDLK